MVFVFKTNVETVAQVEKLQPFLNEHLLKSEWSFDLEDSDKILRVVSPLNITQIVEKEMKKHGFVCVELK